MSFHELWCSLAIVEAEPRETDDATFVVPEFVCGTATGAPRGWSA